MTGDDEDARIARIAAALGRGAALVGIGDDAAVLAPPTEPLVWTIDEQVEDVHFERALCSLEDVGYRATMAAASDLAAMGARPLGALAALVLSADDEVDSISRGQRAACDALGATILGGNLSRGDKLSIATTWLGAAARPILRSGARVGDVVWSCGELGLASAGFRALRAGLAVPHEAVAAWRRPRALVEAGRRMAAWATAALDVSDGVVRDAGRPARASGVRLVLDASALRARVHAATEAVARALGIDALELVLFGGEDYALLGTAPAGAPIAGFDVCGVVEAGDGVFLGADRVTGGFDHFAPPKTSR